MSDAKQALKALFDAISGIKKNTFSSQNKVQDLEHLISEVLNQIEKYFCLLDINVFY